MSEVSLLFFSCKGPLFYLIFFKQYVQRDKYLFGDLFLGHVSAENETLCLNASICANKDSINKKYILNPIL